MMDNLKCILVFVILFLTLFPRRLTEHFGVPSIIESNPMKAGSIQIIHPKDDYTYRLLGMQTNSVCPMKGRNLSEGIKHHNPRPEKAGSLNFEKMNYTDGIPTVSSLPSIDRDDFKRFPTFKHKKRRFPPIEKTSYYPYETILPKKKTKKKPV